MIFQVIVDVLTKKCDIKNFLPTYKQKTRFILSLLIEINDETNVCPVRKRRSQ